MIIEREVLDWLLAGDPVIRFQVQRDLLDQPPRVWRKEQTRTATEGWGKLFLSHQRPDGSWPAARWTGTLWTLLQLLDCGLPADLSKLRKAAKLQLVELDSLDCESLKTDLDLCHVGFWLRIGAAFAPTDTRLRELLKTIVDMQLSDGGWNCQIRNYPDRIHSSFHTTFNVLEGLRQACDAKLIARRKFEKIEARAIEFMLQHRMYKSHRTGRVVKDSMTHLAFPSHWHYTVLRGLEYVRSTKFIADKRLADAIELIESRRKPNGRWPVEKRIPGTVLFDMEKVGLDSRWNTLRVLRVLKARNSAVR